jgi:hypothetical protein
MGRIKKYKSEEEKKAMQRKWSLEYYHRNKEKINKTRMKEYYEKLEKNLGTTKNFTYIVVN